MEAQTEAPASSSSLSDAPTTEVSGPEDTQSRAASSDLSSLDTPRPAEATFPQHNTDNNGQETTSHDSALQDIRTDTITVTNNTDAAHTTQASSHSQTITPLRGQDSGLTRSRSSLASPSDALQNGSNTSITVEQIVATPGSGARGSTRGRGGRTKTRRRGGSKAGKRKREDDDDSGSDSSEIVTPIATVTKSGRSIQKPTTFAPPPPSPPAAKRKRPWQRKNPENAVCKVCLRGSSPASNMIVFCDGCNSPYHRFCHKPPIEQAVIDEVDKEWHCSRCEAERVAPVPEAEIADFVSAEGATAEQVDLPDFDTSIVMNTNFGMKAKTILLEPYARHASNPVDKGNDTAAYTATLHRRVQGHGGVKNRFTATNHYTTCRCDT